ncbi:MAG: LPS translocon maturation chaperone LptM [Janthinobacterium lividum]
MRASIKTTGILAAFCAMALSACGQRGNLYEPHIPPLPHAGAAPAASTPSSSDQPAIAAPAGPLASGASAEGRSSVPDNAGSSNTSTAPAP